MQSDPRSFIASIRKRLSGGTGPSEGDTDTIGADGGPLPSSVLFLLGPHCSGPENGFRPCLILNKRSRMVRQSGDLCCPGGSVSPRTDPRLAKLLGFPGFPLGRWPEWRRWRRDRPDAARSLRLLLATSLRESFEEMRLNPLAVAFLGPLPVQRLIMFRRVIHPMVGWTARQRRFYPNWEVEKIVRIPIDALLNPDHYGRYRIGYHHDDSPVVRDYPCFTHRNGDETEQLWGATFRITMSFLKTVFDFTPPDPERLPLVSGQLDRAYFGAANRDTGR